MLFLQSLNLKKQNWLFKLSFLSVVPNILSFFLLGLILLFRSIESISLADGLLRFYSYLLLIVIFPTYFISFTSLFLNAKVSGLTHRGVKIKTSGWPLWTKRLFVIAIFLTGLSGIISLHFPLPFINSVLLLFSTITLGMQYEDWTGYKKEKVYKVENYWVDDNNLCLIVEGEEYFAPWSQLSMDLAKSPLNERAHFNISPTGQVIYWPSAKCRLDVEFVIDQANINASKRNA